MIWAIGIPVALVVIVVIAAFAGEAYQSLKIRIMEKRSHRK